MTIRVKRLVLLFLPTFLFLTFFSGFYVYLDFYFLPEDGYEWYSFEDGGQMPSDLAIIFSGFRDLPGMCYHIVLSALFSFLGGLFLKRWSAGTSKLKIIFNGIILTLFFGGLYLIFKLLFVPGLFVLRVDRDYFYYEWPDIKAATYIATACYFFIAVFPAYLFSIAKRVQYKTVR